MALFLSTTVNRLDAKGRVSAPAAFRQAVALSAFQGVLVWPNYQLAALDACDYERVEQVARSLDDPERYPLQDALRRHMAECSLAAVKRLGFDANGRIMLPQDFCQHAGLKGDVLFAGIGTTFQMWDPQRYHDWSRGQIEQGRQRGVPLSLRPLLAAG